MVVGETHHFRKTPMFVNVWIFVVWNYNQMENQIWWAPKFKLNPSPKMGESSDTESLAEGPRAQGAVDPKIILLKNLTMDC